MTTKINRRRFLGTAAAIIGGPAIVTGCVTKSAGRPAPSERVVMGAIGLGWQGPGNLKNFLSNKDVQVVALCDVDQNHLMQTKKMVDDAYGNKDCATYTRFEDLYARGDLDAVSIALPDHWHAIPAIAAAEAGPRLFMARSRSPIPLLKAGSFAMRSDTTKRIWQPEAAAQRPENFHAPPNWSATAASAR